ncbi:MAG: hypothetical protein M1814_005963 [Vezdaea aestivalis]|nr:MAG: hypothetical protein M1814_005963 [Vezdaea aestivalis]
MSTTPQNGAAPAHHRGDRLRRLLLRPDGRKVHVASSPEDAQRVHRKLSSVQPPEEFDLVIRGTPEHLEAIREAHSHHSQKQEDQRTQHGEVFVDINNVRDELDALSKELRALTDSNVDLDANFSKYGYSAHLRTRETHNDSGDSSPRKGDETPKSVQDWDNELHHARPVRLWQRPVVRQYFHKGLLWRASEQEEVASFELFVDLLYVGIIAINGDTASEHPTAESLRNFCITFILSWRVWTDLTLVTSWFETDDIVQRLSVIFDMACLFGLTTNIVEAFEHTYSQLIAFYLAARLGLCVYFLHLAWLVPMVRAVMFCYAFWVIVPSALWIGSIYVHTYRQPIIWVAIVLDLYGPTTVIFCVRGVDHVSKRLAARFKVIFEFYPALNIEHQTERTNAFVTLVFGYSVVALLYQNTAALGLNAIFGKAVLGLVMAFAFNWMYFEIDGQNLFVHAIRRSVWSSMLWTTIHLPFIMAYVLGAAALSKLVLAHDCANAEESSLTELYAHRSAGELSHGIRWFYCAGIGLALAGMGIISLSHVHKEIDGQRVKKSHRLTLRFAVAIVIITLGATEKLNSLQLIGTVTSLVCLCLTCDLYGSSSTTQSFIGTGKCSYSANCKLKSKDLEEALKKGETIKLDDVTKGEKHEVAKLDI